MKSIKIIFLIPVYFLFTSYVFASTLTQPQRVIENTSNEIKLILERDKELIQTNPSYVYGLVDDVLIPHVDLDRISGLVLGRDWKRATNNEKQAFKQAFKQMLVRTYATALTNLNDWELIHLPSRAGKNPNQTMVRTKIETDAQPIEIDYRMRDVGQGWKVYDVQIEGISLVTNYRSTFKRIIRTSGINGLISHLMEANDKKGTENT